MKSKNIFIFGFMISIVALCLVIYMLCLEWETQIVPLLYIMLAANIFHICYYYKKMKSTRN